MLEIQQETPLYTPCFSVEDKKGILDQEQKTQA